jgi:hypothetical protein
LSDGHKQAFGPAGAPRWNAGGCGELRIMLSANLIINCFLHFTLPILSGWHSEESRDAYFHSHDHCYGKYRSIAPSKIAKHVRCSLFDIAHRFI